MSKSVTITLDDIVSRTSDLPTFSSAALEVMRLADSSTSKAEDIANLLAQDQALSVRVLRLSNSAYYGVSKTVTNLTEGVVVLSMRTVKNLAMVAATYPWMSKPVEGYGLGPMQLWNHSFGTALGAQTVAKLCGKCDPQLAFTAGLLVDHLHCALLRRCPLHCCLLLRRRFLCGHPLVPGIDFRCVLGVHLLVACVARIQARQLAENLCPAVDVGFRCALD